MFSKRMQIVTFNDYPEREYTQVSGSGKPANKAVKI